MTGCERHIAGRGATQAPNRLLLRHLHGPPYNYNTLVVVVVVVCRDSANMSVLAGFLSVRSWENIVRLLSSSPSKDHQLVGFLGHGRGFPCGRRELDVVACVPLRHWDESRSGWSSP